MQPEHALVYDSPADNWLEALPLGNGRLGAMVFGGRELPGRQAGSQGSGWEHRFQLNDGSAWSGSPHSQELEPHFTREQADAILGTGRRLISEGRHAEAHQTLKKFQHRHSQSYLPFADLFLAVSPTQTSGKSAGQATAADLTSDVKASRYRRSLDLSTAVNSTAYEMDGHEVRIQSFTSHDPSVLVITVDADAPEGLDLRIRLDSQLRILNRSSTSALAALELKMPADVVPSHDGGGVEYSDDDSHSLQGAVAVSWEHNGTSAADAGEGTGEGDLAAAGVRRATIYVTTETTFRGLGLPPEGSAGDAAASAGGRLAAAATTGAPALLARHKESHARLYGSSSISLSVPARTGTCTAERLVAANAHPDGALAADPGLAALMFNYGRYLLISCSRTPAPVVGKGNAWRGTPANLQGLWNNELPAPWSSNFTTNINLEMNYWGAEPTGLAECTGPLFALIEALQETGSATAREYYGARGWTAHHNSDIWAYSKPTGHGEHSPEWSLWPMAGLWLVRHLWDHLQFAAHPESRHAFARDTAWPAIKGASEFALDLLVEFPDGSLGTSPSTSPENNFLAGGQPVAAGESSALDLTLIRDALEMLGSLAAELGREGDPVVAAAREALPRIPEPSVGRNGKLREWHGDPPEAEPDHRHVSHLYLAYPGDTPLSPELGAAVSASLDGRGDESTGWSLAWKILLRARLRQPHKVSDLFALFFRDMDTPRGGHSGGLYPNLFSAHPPFQIDGNLGFVAGLAECLLQSHRRRGGMQEIELLPALPEELPDGAAAGLRARPGVEVDLEWKAGVLTASGFRSAVDRRVLIRYGGHVQELDLRKGESVVLDLTCFLADGQD